MSTSAPPGWPPHVPPPEADGWVDAACSWLLDQCPADYRGQASWRRHPLALAWVARLHVDGQLDAMRTAFRTARVELADDLAPEAVAAVLADIEAEGVRLRNVSRAVGLVHDAMQGKRYVPRL